MSSDYANYILTFVCRLYCDGVIIRSLCEMRVPHFTLRLSHCVSVTYLRRDQNAIGKHKLKTTNVICSHEMHTKKPDTVLEAD